MKLHQLALLFLVPCGLNGTSARAQETPKVPVTLAPAEKVAPDLVAEALWDGRRIVPFKALDFPTMVKADAAGDILDDGDYVLGVSFNGESRAYPTRFAWFHHVINDKIGNVDYAVTYCSVCNTGITYNRRLDNRTVLLDFYGLYNGVVALAERETQTAFLQVTGEFVKGPLTGKSLSKLPLLDTTWGQWKKLHPDTQLMAPPEAFQQFYAPKGKAEPRGYDRFPMPQFENSLTRTDKRLPRFDKVVGVVIPVRRDGGDATVRHAYPIKTLTEANGVLNDTVAGQDVVVLMDLETVTVGAFLRTLNGRTLTFEPRKMPDGKTALFDRETGTRWNIEGHAEDGSLKGKTLPRLENHLSQWYGWSAYFPGTAIYGRTDPPQPEVLKKQ
jgi:hypothetical protein